MTYIAKQIGDRLDALKVSPLRKVASGGARKTP